MTLSILGTLQQAGDTATVSFDRRYETSPADLWQAVTDPERLARWFAPVTGELGVGGDFVIHFDDDDSPTCTVESCSPISGFTWTWHVADRDSLVEVGIIEEGDAARLTLVHRLLDPEKAPEYGAGWDVYLRSLTCFVDGTERGDWWEQWAELRDLYQATTSLPSRRS